MPDIPSPTVTAATLSGVSADLPREPVEPAVATARPLQESGDGAPAPDIDRPATARGPLTSWIRKALLRPADAPATSNKTFATGLDEREYRFSVAATVLALGFVTAGYIVNRHSSALKVRDAALTLLIGGLILVAIMAAGVIFRRGSIVGIASFMMGFELITSENIFGALFLVLGGWLLVRTMRRQRAELGAGTRPSRSAKTKPERPLGPPKPSKRYTPPRRTRSSARRR
jgi:hypothetical protein